MGIAGVPIVALLLALIVCPLLRWGPHPEIADAAIAVLPIHDQARVVLTLGDEARRLRFLVWNHWQAAGEQVAIEFAEHLVAPKDAQYARVLIATKDDPPRSIKSISLTPY